MDAEYAKIIGNLQAKVDHLEDGLIKLEDGVERIGIKVDSIHEQITEAKGGWRMLLMVGGACASAAAGGVWLLQQFRWR